MGKLSHIKDRMNPPPMDGLLQPIVEHIAGSVKAQLSADMSRGGEGLHAVKSTLGKIEPAIRQLVQELAGHVVDRLVEQHESLNKQHESLTANQRAIMRALAETPPYPDYSEQLARLEARGVDLTPLSKQIKALMAKVSEKPEERPLQWVFDIKRNKKGLIESVTATAED